MDLVPFQKSVHTCLRFGAPSIAGTSFGNLEKVKETYGQLRMRQIYVGKHRWVANGILPQTVRSCVFGPN